jgi:ABC-2 type transport system ATP-binding protein
MEEADQLCGRVAIIDHGKILVSGTPEELKSSVGAQRVFQLQLQSPSADGLRGSLAALPGVTGVESAETGLVVFTNGRAGLLPEIVGVAGDKLKDISVSETTLESVFIKLTGRDLRD